MSVDLSSSAPSPSDTPTVAFRRAAAAAATTPFDVDPAAARALAQDLRSSAATSDATATVAAAAGGAAGRGVHVSVANDRAEHKGGSSTTDDQDAERARALLALGPVAANDFCPVRASVDRISVLRRPSPAEMTYKKVMDLPASEQATRAKWMAAMDKELQTLQDKQVFKLVHVRDVPRDAEVLGTRWVLSDKIKSDRSVVCKARLVAQGYVQDLPKDEVFSPTTSLHAVRLLIANAAYTGRRLVHLDIKAAYLNAHLDVPVYARPPQGMDVPQDHLLLLQRALYGLQQAARAWYDELSGFLHSLGFTSAAQEKGAFVHSDWDLHVAVHVDDMIISFDSDDKLGSFLKTLAAKYDLSEIRKDFTSTLFLGMDLEKTPTGYHLHQATYVKRLLDRYRHQDCVAADTPMASSFVSGGGNDVPVKAFQEIVGALLWLAMCTRPDIAYSVSRVAECVSAPKGSDLTAAFRILKYLKGTVDTGLAYHRAATKTTPCFTLWVDADWAACAKTRKSRTGYLLNFAGAPVMWRSKKQTCVALASNEAEFVAISDALRDLQWFGFASKLVVPHRIVKVFSDSQGAIALVRSPGTETTRRSKHIEVRNFFAKDFFQQHTNVFLDFVPTEHQLADALTKPLPAPAYLSLTKAFVARLEGGCK